GAAGPSPAATVAGRTKIPAPMVVLTMLAVRRRTPIARTNEASAFLKILRSSNPQILRSSNSLRRQMVSRPAAAPVASASPLCSSAAFDPLRRPEAHEPSIAVTSSIPLVATIALGLYRDGRLGRFGVLALHAGRTPCWVEHF